MEENGRNSLRPENTHKNQESRSHWMTLARRLFCLQLITLLTAFLASAMPAAASDTLLGGHHAKHEKNGPPPDYIVFTNGDKLSGTLVRAVGSKVTFESEVAGTITVSWKDIQELHTTSRMAVLTKTVSPQHGAMPEHVPEGTLSVVDGLITVQPADHANLSPIAILPQIPVKKARYIIDEKAMENQLFGHPGFFGGWNGSMTAGATIVQATQKQYTFSGGIALARVEPSASWLDPNNRTIIDFTGSYGKITQRSYVSGGVFYPATDSKSAIYHAAAERDQYFSTRFYALAQTTFDHNYGQGLDLQQIYGGGIGATVLKQPRQELDFKATAQYEKQDFINASDKTNQNLVGSTFAGAYILHLFRGLIFNQQVAYLPAYNNLRAYSATESNTLAIPFYKSLSFSVGTQDSYLNDPPASEPPPLRNSFQFTFGATYSFRSKD